MDKKGCAQERPIRKHQGDVRCEALEKGKEQKLRPWSRDKMGVFSTVGENFVATSSLSWEERLGKGKQLGTVVWTSQYKFGAERAL